jgi:hypothetical protein
MQDGYFFLKSRRFLYKSVLLDRYCVILISPKKNREEHIMKAATIHRSVKSISRPYPNAADRRYYIRKLVDGLLAAATVVGGLTALAFLLLL